MSLADAVGIGVVDTVGVAVGVGCGDTVGVGVGDTVGIGVGVGDGDGVGMCDGVGAIISNTTFVLPSTFLHGNDSMHQRLVGNAASPRRWGVNHRARNIGVGEIGNIFTASPRRRELNIAHEKVNTGACTQINICMSEQFTMSHPNAICLDATRKKAMMHCTAPFGHMTMLTRHVSSSLKHTNKASA